MSHGTCIGLSIKSIKKGALFERLFCSCIDDKLLLSDNHTLGDDTVAVVYSQEVGS